MAAVEHVHMEIYAELNFYQQLEQLIVIFAC